MELHPLGKVVIGVLGIGVITVAIWLGRFSGNLPVDDPVAAGEPSHPGMPDPGDEDVPLPISPTGPYPKVVVTEMIYKFPTMSVGGNGRHVFKIQNKGDAPLLLKKGKTTCKCTISEVGEGEIPPGGETDVELTWKAAFVSPEFRQTAKIFTNDPDLKTLELIIEGSIDAQIKLIPEGVWTLDKLSENMPTTAFGYVTSTVHDSFGLKSPIESSSKVLTAKAIALTPEECKQLSIKSGYKIEATIQPKMPIGQFREYFTIHTDLPDASPMEITVEGARTGPITMIAIGKTRWHSKAMLVNLGEFDAAEGAKATLLMFVSGLEETDFKFLSVEKDPETFQITLEPDPNFQRKTRQKLRLTFEIPPGAPALTRGIDRPARILIKTNHPQADELKFRIQFISR